MVSFWPFRGDDTSAASFERVLKDLSTKITKASAQNDQLRQRQRKYKVLWTLYAIFAYIIIAVILVLITGWERWGPIEYTIVAGGPPFIYAIRTSLDSYYSFRVNKSQKHLNDLSKQRDASIEKLKTATRYNSTQELLDKYGKKSSDTGKDLGGKKGAQGAQGARPGQPPSNVQRTGFAPPPTANISRSPVPNSNVSTTKPLDDALPSHADQHSVQHSRPQTSAGLEAGEEFAPNAFSPNERPPHVRQQSVQYAEGPKWYDRILDVMLGEDETQAKHRIALICQNCRLVNGQAPPGMRTLEDVGRWRCAQCQAWNGVESEAARILRQATSTSTAESPSHKPKDEGDSHEGLEDHPSIEPADSKDDAEISKSAD